MAPRRRHRALRGTERRDPYRFTVAIMNSRTTPPSGEPNTAPGPPTTPYAGVFTQQLGVWYPKNYVIAALDAAEGAPAMEDLFAAGFGHNAVYLHDSADMRAVRQQIVEGRSRMQRSAAALTQAVTDEGSMAQDYFDESDGGASLLGVFCPEPRLVEDARRVLKAHGARHIRFYGDNSITDLH
jgi:hypothetical protein